MTDRIREALAAIDMAARWLDDEGCPESAASMRAEIRAALASPAPAAVQGVPRSLWLGRPIIAPGEGVRGLYHATDADPQDGSQRYDAFPQAPAQTEQRSTDGSTEGRAALSGQSQPYSHAGDGSGNTRHASTQGNRAHQAGIKHSPSTNAQPAPQDELADELEQEMRRSVDFPGGVIVDKRTAMRILAALRGKAAESGKGE